MSNERMRTDLRREQIARTAMDLVTGRGITELTMEGLSRRIGVAPSAIYHHFRNKDEVIDAVLDLLKERLLGNVRAVVAECRDPLDRLQRLLTLHVNLILDYSALPRVIFSEQVYGGNPERKAKLYDIISSYLGEIASIIREGQEQNRIRPELDAGTLSVMFLGLVQPTAILWHLSDGTFDAAQHVDRAWPVFRDAVAAR